MWEDVLFGDGLSSLVQAVVLKGESEVEPGEEVAHHGQVHDVLHKGLLDDCDGPDVDGREQDECKESEVKQGAVTDCRLVHTRLYSSRVMKEVRLHLPCAPGEDRWLVGHLGQTDIKITHADILQ
jgi:hypothetical protein